MQSAPFTALVVLLIASCASAQGTSKDECTRTASMRIYSNASFSKETGDVNGYELAVKQLSDPTLDALLYVYEGAPNNNGIHLSGRISGKKLTVEGNWVEQLVEYPSKKEIVHTHFVRIDGTLDSAWFRGKMRIEDLSVDDVVRLKRVAHVWLCGR
jgi:hypothetical protein